MWGKTFFDKFMGDILHEKNNDHIMPRGRKRFPNAISSNLNNVNLQISSNHGGYTLQVKPWAFYKIMEGFILGVNSQEVSKVLSTSYFPDLGYWCIVWKVKTTKNWAAFKKHPLHTMPQGLEISCKSLTFFQYL